MSDAHWANANRYAPFYEISSLDEAVSPSGEGDPTPLIETIADPGPSPEEDCARRERLAKVAPFVASLTPRLRYIAQSYFWDGKTQTVIADSLGISVPAVSQALSKVIKMGRAYFGVTEH